MLGKVLVADDNLNVQKLVAAALKPEDIEVVAVGHGEAAVRKIPEVRPDLVLADIFMPVRTGYEVCEFIKNDPSLAHIPVLLLVGAFEPLDQKEVGRVRADGYLKKPFEAAQLVSTVKGYLSKIPRKPVHEMVEAAQEFAAAIPPEEASGEEAAPFEPFSARPEPVHFEGAESEKPLAFGELLGEAAPAAVEEPIAPASFVPSAFEGAAIPAEDLEPAQPEPLLAELAPPPDVFAEQPFAAEPAAELAPMEAAPTFEAPPVFEELAPEAASAWDAPAPPPSMPEELIIEKEAQSWEIQTPLSARDPMLAESVTDFMAAPPEVKLPEMPVWETAAEDWIPEEAPAEAAPTDAPAVDPALVEAVVQQVMERLTPQIVETVAREVVRPLAESLLREKLEQQSQ